MESPENSSFVKNLSLNTSSNDTELDNITFILSNTFSNVSEQNATVNETEEVQVLYQVPTAIVVVLSLFYGAICITAILGNLLVLCLVLVS